jgi:serine/threonine protein kinase
VRSSFSGDLGSNGAVLCLFLDARQELLAALSSKVGDRSENPESRNELSESGLRLLQCQHMSTPVEPGAGQGASSSAESMSGTLAPGTIIAERYRIDALLGEGGMGKVYAAEHVLIQKQVAIKVLHEEMSSTPEYVARFEREAVAAAKITHPNVAAASDFGRLPNASFFIVLEYIAGIDLRTLLNSGALPKDRAVRIVRQIAAAVSAAHAVGVIHRDLKPENVMVVDHEGDRDFVKVLDFGIAKLDSFGPSQTTPGSSPGQAPLTKIGSIFGTPDYMSPEQALGQAVDPRTDLYSLGVIFYELVTGERLFKGGAVTLMRSHVLEQAPPLPEAVSGELGPELEAIIQKLLQKSPDDRFGSAGELIAALDSAALDAASPNEPAKTAAFPLVAPPVRNAEEEAPRPASKRASGESSLEQSPRRPSFDSIPEPPRKKGRSFGLTILVLVAAGVGFLYFYGPPDVVRSLLDDAPQSSSGPSRVASPEAPPVSASSPPASSAPAAGRSSEAQEALGSASIATSAPEATSAAAPSDSVEPALDADAGDASPVARDAATPPRPSASHLAPPKPTPTPKPVHKPVKPAASTKHPAQPTSP